MVTARRSLPSCGTASPCGVLPHRPGKGPAAVSPSPGTGSRSFGESGEGNVEPIGFPFRFGVTGPLGPFAFDETSEWLMVSGPQGILHVERTDGTCQKNCRAASCMTPCSTNVEAAPGVTDGFVVAVTWRASCFSLPPGSSHLHSVHHRSAGVGAPPVVLFPAFPCRGDEGTRRHLRHGSENWRARLPQARHSVGDGPDSSGLCVGGKIRRASTGGLINEGDNNWGGLASRMFASRENRDRESEDSRR